MVFEGTILKMSNILEDPVQYKLPIGNKKVHMNPFIGKYIIFKYDNQINCIFCERKIKKSFAQGFCYPCFISIPQTSECILRPQLCEAQNGIARDMEWAEAHCLQDHHVYLAISSGLKVGVTRSTQIPTRWIDQGAWKAIKLAQTPNRYIAGLIEVHLKEYISDRTQWQRMLKNQLIKEVDLHDQKRKMIGFLPNDLKKYECLENQITEILYPVKEYPKSVKSLSFDKSNEIYGRLWGIKGQYLIFDDGKVLNIRKHNGYKITLEI